MPRPQHVDSIQTKHQSDSGGVGTEANPDVLKNRKICSRAGNRITIPCSTSPLPSLNTDSAIDSEQKACAAEQKVS
jgi:hypothetical protein